MGDGGMGIEISGSDKSTTGVSRWICPVGRANDSYSGILDASERNESAVMGGRSSYWCAR